MDLNALSQRSTQLAKQNRQNALFSNNWIASGEAITKLAVPKNLLGSEDSFLQRSEVLNVLLKQINVDHLTIPDLILLSQSAKAIEDGDSKAAQFVRDTTGGKPVEKHEHSGKNMHDLSDGQVEWLMANAEIIDITDE